MDSTTIIALASVGLKAAVDLSSLFQKAVEAANNGDLPAAEAYLAQSRTHFDTARAAWDAAAPVDPAT